LIPGLTRIIKTKGITIAKKELVAMALAPFRTPGSLKNQNLYSQDFFDLPYTISNSEYSKFLDAGFVIVNFVF